MTQTTVATFLKPGRKKINFTDKPGNILNIDKSCIHIRNKQDCIIIEKDSKIYLCFNIRTKY